MNCDDYLPFEKVRYSDDNNDVIVFGDVKKQWESFSYYLRHKKDCWKTENEYRAICMDDPKFRGEESFETKLFYPDDFLAEINFGYKVDPNRIGKIVETLCSQNKMVKFFRIEPDYDTYELKQTPIDFN